MKTFTVQKSFNVSLETTIKAKDVVAAAAAAEALELEGDFVTFVKGAYVADEVEKPEVIAVLG